MERLSEHLFAETGFLWANVGAAATEAGVLLIDCPVRPSDSRRWQEEVRALSPNGIRSLICTDYHGDHTTGAAFVGDVVFIAPQRVYEELARPDRNHQFSKQNFIDALNDIGCPEEAREIEEAAIPLPQICFQEDLILHYSPLTFLIHRLGGHTRACSVVHVPEEGVLFAGDVLITEPCPGLRDACVREWLDALNYVQGLPVEKIVPGHGEVCGMEEVKKLEGYLSGLWECMEGFVRDGARMEEAVADSSFDEFFWADTSRGSHWAEHRKYTFRRGLERIYDEVKGVAQAN